MSDCLFCGIIAGEVPAQIVHETDLTVAFRDISPVAPVHVLVVPRRHIENASTIDPEHAPDVSALFSSARSIAESEGIATSDRGYRLVFNVGSDANNTVPHLHLHVLGGRSMSWPPG